MVYTDWNWTVEKFNLLLSRKLGIQKLHELQSRQQQESNELILGHKRAIEETSLNFSELLGEISSEISIRSFISLIKSPKDYIGHWHVNKKGWTIMNKM